MSQADASGPRSGVVLQGVDAPGDFRAMVGEIEGLGFDHLWLTDSSLHARNCYSYLTLAAVSSSRLLLGTAVTNPATRHPAITAAAAATVDEVAGGRLILGIGAGDRPLLALGLRPSPLATLEAAIGGIRQLWSGAEVSLAAPGVTLDGAHLRFGARPDIPVYISASGPKTLELSGRIADGVILLVGLFPEALDWAVAQVDRGAKAAGRRGRISRSSPTARSATTRMPPWSRPGPSRPGSRRPRRRICDLAGLPRAVADRVRAGYQGGEFQEAAAAARELPAEFVRKVALAGNEQRAAGQIRAALAAGADSVHVFPLGADRMATVRAFARAWPQAAAR